MGIAKSIIKGIAKGASKASKRIKGAFKKKKLITKKQFTQRGSATGRKSKFGTKGSAKGWAAFNKTQTGAKTATKGAKGKKSIFDRNINPLAGKKTLRGAGQSIKSGATWVKQNPGTAALYGLGIHYTGKQLGAWGGKNKNTPEPKPEIRNYIPKPKPKKLSRGGSSSRVGPGMNAGGGGLRYINGKWTR
tara:strand:- start:342 stop:911 length:570 start_codon:yes stop_codon:yes gene_type:complete